MVFEYNGAGEPLLLIHGTGSSRAVWRPIRPGLLAERRLVLVDLPGFGDSPRPAAHTALTPAGYAMLLARELDEAAIAQIDVCGHSVGGWTALELAKLGRVRSLVALAPAGLWAKRSPRRTDAVLRLNRALGKRTPPLAGLALRSRMVRRLVLSSASYDGRNVHPRDALASAWDMARAAVFEEHFAATRATRFTDGQAIRGSVTVVFGRNDRVAIASSRRRDELPARTRWIELDRCGHMPMWDQPEETVRLILDGVRSG